MAATDRPEAWNEAISVDLFWGAARSPVLSSKPQNLSVPTPDDDAGIGGSPVAPHGLVEPDAFLWRWMLKIPSFDVVNAPIAV